MDIFTKLDEKADYSMPASLTSRRSASSSPGTRTQRDPQQAQRSSGQRGATVI